MHWIVIGTGNISKRHRCNIRKIDPDAKITAYVSHRKIRSEDKNLNDIDHLDDCQDNVLKSKPEAIIVATPATEHISEAEFWLKNNIPVFIEKPVAAEQSDAIKLIPYQKNSIIMVGYVLRFFPILQELKKIISSNKFGAIKNITAHVGSYLPDWRPDINYKESVSASPDLGGGALLELSHEIDYILWLAGIPSSISAETKNSGTLDIEVEDTANISLKFSKDITGNIHLNFLQKPPQRFCKIIFEKAELNADIITGTLEIKPCDGDKVIHHFKPKDPNQPYLDELKNFMNAIHNHQSPLISLEDGINVLKVIDAAKSSS